MEKQEFYSAGSRIRGLKKSGRYEEAEEEIRKGLEKNPDDLFLKARLADLYGSQGRLIEGRVLVPLLGMVKKLKKKLGMT